MARKQDERVCGGGEGAVSEAQARPVVTLALEKRLFRTVLRKRPVVTLRGKKS